MAEKVTLSNHWRDEEGWAGEAGKQYLPGKTVTFENPGHAQLLRQAGYEATDVQPAAKKASAPKPRAPRAAKKAAAKKSAAPSA